VRGELVPIYVGSFNLLLLVRISQDNYRCRVIAVEAHKLGGGARLHNAMLGHDIPTS